MKRYKIKALDDAITEQGSVLNRTSQSLSRLTRKLDRWISQEPEAKDLDFTDKSPFRKIDEKDLLSLDKVKKVYKDIPRFMYLDTEKETFDNEYKNILDRMVEFIEQVKAYLEEYKTIITTEIELKPIIEYVNKVFDLLEIDKSIKTEVLRKLKKVETDIQLNGEVEGIEKTLDEHITKIKAEV